MEHSVEQLIAKHGDELADDELAHYGKLGMRWGKRKSRDSSESDAGPPKPSIKDLSDSELKAAINRIKMERELTALMAPQVSTGRKIVQEILLDVGKQQAKNYLNSSITAFASSGLQGTIKTATKAKPAAPAAPAPRQVYQFNKNHGLKV